MVSGIGLIFWEIENELNDLRKKVNELENKDKMRSHSMTQVSGNRNLAEFAMGLKGKYNLKK